MKFLKNPEIKNALYGLIFYCIIILGIGIIWSSGKFKSGMCGPNYDILSFLLVGPLSLILLIVNLLLKFFTKRATNYSSIIHFTAFLIWAIMLFY
jgi:hypothetical protein